MKKILVICFLATMLSLPLVVGAPAPGVGNPQPQGTPGPIDNFMGDGKSQGILAEYGITVDPTLPGFSELGLVNAAWAKELGYPAWGYSWWTPGDADNSPGHDKYRE